MDIISKQVAQTQLLVPSWISQLAAEVQTSVREMARRRKLKQELGRLSERALRDIGLTEVDIKMVDSLPMDGNCEKKLSDSKRTRAGNW